MPNERLRGAIAAAGLTYEDLAVKVQVTPKTVERWITKGRTPHRSHRLGASGLLGQDEVYLWPEVADDPRTKTAGQAELIEFFPSRSAVPPDVWTQLVDGAKESIDYLAFGGLFVLEHNEFVSRLMARAHAGVRVRVLLGDPRGQAVHRRGEEEGTFEGMAERARLCARYFWDAVDVPGFEVRLHDTTLYASIYRGDDVALVNVHSYGTPAAHNPVLHLQRITGGRTFDHYIRSFERVWELATPLTADALSGRKGA